MRGGLRRLGLWAALARRRAGLYGLGCTTATLADLKGRLGRGGPHRGLKQAGDDAQHGVVGEVGGGRRRSSRMNRRRESPGLRERRGGPRGHCKGVEGFRAARAPAAARNFGSGGVHLRRMLGEIPALAWLNSWLGRWLRRRWDPAGMSWRLRRGGSASACGSRGNRGAGILQRTRDRALSDPGLASRRRGVD